MDIVPGNYVRLAPREAPHHGSPYDWYEVTAVYETCFDARRWVQGTVMDRRFGVPYDAVLACRPRDTGTQSGDSGGPT